MGCCVEHTDSRWISTSCHQAGLNEGRVQAWLYQPLFLKSPSPDPTTVPPPALR